MRAVVVDEAGQVPQCRELPEPEVPEGRVLARVRAAAVKNIERMLVAGTHYGSGRTAFPSRVGLDAVVELPDGRRVYARAAPPVGAMAEYLPVDPAQVVDVPDGVSDADAAAVPNAAASAWCSLEHAARIRPGQSVLVLGGTGVTGGFAVQLAKRRFGAGRVSVAGRSGPRLERLRELGADAAVRIGDDSSALTEAVHAAHGEHPFDLVLDYLWGAPAEAVLRALANDDMGAAFHRTRFVQIGETAGPTVELPASVLRSAGVELIGQGAGSVPREAFARIGTEILPELFAMLAEGGLAVETAVRPLAEVAEAWTEPAPSGVRTVLVP